MFSEHDDMLGSYIKILKYSREERGWHLVRFPFHSHFQPSRNIKSHIFPNIQTPFHVSYQSNSVNNGSLSWDAIGVEKVPNDELFKVLSCYFPISVPIDDLHVGGNVSRGGLEALIHGSIAIDQPFGYFDGLAYSISVSIIGFYYFSKWLGRYLARLRHSSLVKSPPF